MTCGPLPLTPQIISTTMALFGQPAGLPQDLSQVLKGPQPEIRAEVLCDGSNKVVGFSVERYLDTKTRFTSVVPLDDGEVDEQTSYVHSLTDGRVAQKVTFRIDGEDKFVHYASEVRCDGNNLNAPVCTNHVPTIQALNLPISKGAHADWMQTFVSEIPNGAEYVFLTEAEYPAEKKTAEDKRKAAASASASASALPPPPTATATATAPVPQPSASAVPSETPKKDSEEKGSDNSLLMAAIIAFASVAGLYMLLNFFKQKGKDGDSNKVKRLPHPDAAAAVRQQQIEDTGIPPPVKEPAALPKPKATGATQVGGASPEILAELAAIQVQGQNPPPPPAGPAGPSEPAGGGGEEPPAAS